MPILITGIRHENIFADIYHNSEALTYDIRFRATAKAHRQQYDVA